jgi:hypothetical protein
LPRHAVFSCTNELDQRGGENFNRYTRPNQPVEPVNRSKHRPKKSMDAFETRAKRLINAFETRCKKKRGSRWVAGCPACFATFPFPLTVAGQSRRFLKRPILPRWVVVVVRPWPGCVSASRAVRGIAVEQPASHVAVGSPCHVTSFRWKPDGISDSSDSAVGVWRGVSESMSSVALVVRGHTHRSSTARSDSSAEYLAGGSGHRARSQMDNGQWTWLVAA